MISGIPFEGPIGAVRVAYSTDGQWIPHPSFQEGDESTFELVVAGRALSDADDAEIAIMMVEAGGSERSFQYYDEGAPQVTEEVLADGLEAAKTWIRESIVLQRQMVEAYVAARGPVETIEYSTFSDYGDDVLERVQAVGTGRCPRPTPSWPRPSATPPSTPPPPPSGRRWPPSSPTGRARSRRRCGA